MAAFSEDQTANIERLIESHGVTRRLSSGQKWDVALLIGGWTLAAIALLGFGGVVIVNKAARDAAMKISAIQVASELQDNKVLIGQLGAVLSNPPSGAVLAFDISTEKGCPNGWEPFQVAAGRMIVGAGVNNNTDSNGAALTDYPALQEGLAGAFGGEERTKLSVQQLPSHSHPILRTDRKDGDGKFVNWASMGGPNNKSTGQGTAAVGDNHAHNNMPPYIALYFCKKD